MTKLESKVGRVKGGLFVLPPSVPPTSAQKNEVSTLKNQMGQIGANKFVLPKGVKPTAAQKQEVQAVKKEMASKVSKRKKGGASGEKLKGLKDLYKR